MMTRIWYGEIALQKAMDEGQVSVVAPPVYTRNISQWLGISGFATGEGRFIAPA